MQVTIILVVFTTNFNGIKKWNASIDYKRQWLNPHRVIKKTGTHKNTEIEFRLTFSNRTSKEDVDVGFVQKEK